MYTGVCELSQTSQTRIRTEPGDNQCSNIATQGFLRETSETVRQSRCHSPCGFHFPLPWLLSGEAGAGHRAQFRPQAANQPVTGSLVAMRDRSLTVPCMVARPSAMQVPHLWQSCCSQPPTSSPSPLLALVLLPKQPSVIPAGILEQPRGWLVDQELRGCSPLLHNPSSCSAEGTGRAGTPSRELAPHIAGGCSA